ncbi:hypothetical protein [Acidovorax sp. LjRoot118]|uniref:hypothetical protein n=1 Tax=Acidovorax sp. LjRoot118 TaxID=3342256 RepID=UPI003F50370B
MIATREGLGSALPLLDMSGDTYQADHSNNMPFIRSLTRTALIFAAGATVALVGANWYAKSQVDEARSKIGQLQGEITTKTNELLGFTKYTTFLTVGKQALTEQAKLIAASITREEGSTQIVEASILGLKSASTVAVTYTAEYSFGFDLRPDKYELRATDKGLEIHVNRPTLLVAPGITNLRHRVLNGGLLTDDKGVIIRMMQDASKRAEKQGQALASEPSVMALSEKSLTSFLHGFLAKQPGVRIVPHITVVYRQPPKEVSAAQ